NGSTLQISLINGFVPAPTDSFVLIQSNQLLAGFFSNVADGGLLTLPEGDFTVTYAGQNGVTLSNFAAIPEPSTYGALAGLGVLAVTLGRRRALRRASR
ncbi:MAG: hypothetical protein RIQ79_2208, partial [Verrucomicrobiota bacterium]